jgi:two-component system chemotaxis response regulator CheY
MKILIVDDAESSRVQLRRDLESKNYSVIEGIDGVDGMEVLAKNADVRLIITDVNMPRMDGLSMAKKIHELPNGKEIPIIVMTTEVGAELKARGKEAGVLAWVTKPYVTEKFLQAVAKIIK